MTKLEKELKDLLIDINALRKKERWPLWSLKNRNGKFFLYNGKAPLFEDEMTVRELVMFIRGAYWATQEC